MGMTDEEREKHIRIANMLIGAINDLERPMLMYQIEKDVAREALENYIKMLEQQPFEDVVSIGVFEQVKWERDVAIEQLEQLGYSLGEKIRTSEDCISRQAVLDNAYAYGNGLEPEGYCVNVEDIQALPSVTSKTSCESCREQVLKHLEKEDWADTVNCVMNMPFINKSCVSEGVCREDKMQVLDKIRDEIEALYDSIDTVSHNEYENAYEQGKERAYEFVLDIIDKYKAESEDNNDD